MTKFPENGAKLVSLFGYARRTGLYDVEPCDRAKPETLAEIRDSRRLKGFLKRAVEKDFAPKSLIEAIKIGIRR